MQHVHIATEMGRSVYIIANYLSEINTWSNVEIERVHMICQLCTHIVFTHKSSLLLNKN